MTALAELGERELLRRIRSWVGEPSLIGDDCAVLPPNLAVTTDTLVQGIDFDLSYMTWEEVGGGAAAANLSDLAAMGATPTALFVSLSIPPVADVDDIEALYRGMTAKSRTHGALIAGGDLSSPPKDDHGWTITITAIGTLEHGAVLRSGAKPGDQLCVTGTLGESARALRALQSGTDVPEELRREHTDPIPRIDVGKLFAEHGAHAMIDISDGLVIDLERVLEASNAGAVVRFADIPRKTDDPDLVLTHGEDFELLVAATPSTIQAVQAKSPVPITVIGEITDTRSLRIVDAAGVPMKIETKGFQHFTGEPT